MRFFNKIFLSLVLVASLSSVFGQDAHFSQFYANPLYLNPAFAGTQVCPRFVMNYRNQWPGINNAFNTISASYDKHYDGIQGGLGFQFMNDYEADGALSNIRAAVSYSYRMEINHKYSLKTGFEAAFDQKSIDPNKLTFNDQIDPRYGFVDFNGAINPTAESFPRTKRNKLDLSVGTLIYGEKYFAGLAAHHLTEPDEGLNKVSKLPMKVTFHAGAVFQPSEIIEDLTVSPNLIYQSQGGFNTLNTGVYVNKDILVFGLWYRMSLGSNADAMNILLGIKQKTYRIGYSYDLTLSRLRTNSAGAHELSLAIDFKCKKKKRKFKTISCPVF